VKECVFSVPFTLSHPAFAAPIKKLVPSLSMTGLVLGSMAPDLEYFVAFETHRTIGHTYLGFLLMHIPLCIAFALAYHRLFKPTLPLLLPTLGRMDRIAASDSTAKWGLRTIQQWGRFLISLFIGFLTHLFMDGWTHRHTVFVDHFDRLREEYAGLQLYKLLQYGFSLLGAGVIVLYLLYRWYSGYRRSRDQHRAAPIAGKMGFRLITFTVAAVIFAFKFSIAWDTSSFGFVFVAPFSAFMLGWLTAIWLHRASDWQKLVRAGLGLASLAALAVAYQAATYWLDRYGYMRLDIDSWQEYDRVRTALWLLYIWGLSTVLIVASRGNRTNTRLRTGCLQEENAIP
jgi:hypothetical protein